MNVLIYMGLLLISMLSLYFFRKLLGNLGLKIVFVLMSITSFILSFKYISLTTINLNSNCITYVTMYSSLYLLLDNTSKEDVKKITNQNFIINIFFSIILYLMTNHTSSITDTIGINIKNVFEVNSIILLTYPIVTLISNYLLIVMYEKIKKLYDNMFITTVTTFMLIGIIEGIIYTTISYYNILNFKTIIELILSTYMIKLILTVIYSIYLMFITKKKVSYE